MGKSWSKSLFPLAMLLCLSVAAEAQGSWTVQGRTNQVRVERRQFGDVKVSIFLSYPEPGIPLSETTVEGVCADSLDASCYFLSLSPSCDWSAVPGATRSVLSSLIGGAWCGSAGHPVCITSSGTFPWGEAWAAQSWQCSGGAPSANCNTMAGDLTPGLRISTIGPSSGCSL